MRRKTKIIRKKNDKHPHHKKQVMAPWRPPPAFRKKFVLFHKRGSAEEVVQIGRKAKPIHLHLLEGNTNRLTKDEIEQRLKAENSYKQKGQGKTTNVVRFSCEERI